MVYGKFNIENIRLNGRFHGSNLGNDLEIGLYFYALIYDKNL